MHPFLCPFQHEQKIKELEAEIQELEAELQYTKFLLDQEKAAFQALERKVEKHLGCRYKGDAAQKCKVAATALARSDAAKADIAHMKSKTRYRAVQRWEEKYGEQWNSVLRQKIREADRIKVTNEQAFIISVLKDSDNDILQVASETVDYLRARVGGEDTRQVVVATA